MILYGSTISPYVRKCVAFAAEKGIELEVKMAGMGRGSPEFMEASPFGKMPGFQDGDFLISDSTAIVTYLEAIRPEPNLIPTEAKARARAVWYEEFGDTILMGAGQKIFFNRVVKPKFMGEPGDEAAAAAGEAELPKIYDYIEKVLPASGFLVEDRLTLADIAVASPFANFGFMGMDVDAGRWPRTAAYVAKVLGRPSFAECVAKDRALFGI